MQPESAPAAASAEPVMTTPREDPWDAVAGLSCQLSVALNVPGFRVRDLLDLDVGSVVDSGVNSADPVAVWVNGVRVGLAEFDVLGARLAIRIRELG